MKYEFKSTREDGSDNPSHQSKKYIWGLRGTWVTLLNWLFVLALVFSKIQKISGQPASAPATPGTGVPGRV
jgi:hypothetical protein